MRWDAEYRQGRQSLFSTSEVAQRKRYLANAQYEFDLGILKTVSHTLYRWKEALAVEKLEEIFSDSNDT